MYLTIFYGVLMDVWHAKEFIGRLIDGPHIDLRAQRIRVRSVEVACKLSDCLATYLSSKPTPAA